ncbi:putative O-methyltransferase YrrM [Antricoccus suffuscus]|uniref:Putative O-methyltransferase YrrM n=1 Tax=Antricoccus suffuscus TaxID=1629062 RepID=A0A2T0ZC14_9ACTN|nr:O-methyltransferase [Antricoccus suffuscus]PRZ33885.1 putative O-methyltransferase YrrM [Antricoccus suffuscus]
MASSSNPSGHIYDDGWTAVEQYLSDTVVRPDHALIDGVRRAREAGMPAIEVAPTAGKFLMLLAKIGLAKRVLEVGTLAGFSTTWLARGVGEHGHVITCEREQLHADLARANVDRAGVGSRVDIRVGPATDTLRQLVEAGAEPFDLVFIDADKPNNLNYLTAALQLTRSGSVIVLDNVVWDGRVVDADSADPNVRAIRESLEFIGTSADLDATAVQTVSSKGWDGFAIAVVK